MDLDVTSAALVICLALAGFFGWMGAKPPNIHRGPRLVPYRLLMLLMAAGVVVLAAHEATLLGLVRSPPTSPNG
jgi:hypothetical protein